MAPSAVRLEKRMRAVSVGRTQTMSFGAPSSGVAPRVSGSRRASSAGSVAASKPLPTLPR